MQRVRVGLTGLAVVLIIIALTTALFSTLDRQAGVSANEADATAEKKNGDEPLADLGMAPGAPGQNQADPGPPPVAPALPEQP